MIVRAQKAGTKKAAATKSVGTAPQSEFVIPKGLMRKVVSKDVSFGDKDTDILRGREYIGNDAARDLRNQSKTVAAIRQLAKADGMMSSAVFNYSEVANSGWKAYAYDPVTGEFLPEATLFLVNLLEIMDKVPRIDLGCNTAMAMAQVVETLLDEAVKTNACCLELVLDKNYLPERFVVVPYETVTKVRRGDGTWYPEQRGNGDPVNLDIPTFFMSEFHIDAGTAYVTPMMTAALKDSFHFGEFVDDMRRVLKKSGHGRVLAKLNAENVKRAAPPEVQSDSNKLKEWMASVRDEMASVLKDVEPEDAIVFYDVADVTIEHAKGDKADYKELLQALSGMAATSMKTNPSMLGLRLAGSQSLSNTESLVFLRTAAGIQRPVSTVLSRAFTLALRLYGFNAYVCVEFDAINLRPDDELEAFKVMKESRIMTQLSYGRISDEEANQALGLGPLPANAPRLSGTMFLDSKQVDVSKTSPNTGAQENALTSSAPNHAGGTSQ